VAPAGFATGTVFEEGVVSLFVHRLSFRGLFCPGPSGTTIRAQYSQRRFKAVGADVPRDIGTVAILLTGKGGVLVLGRGISHEAALLSNAPLRFSEPYRHYLLRQRLTASTSTREELIRNLRRVYLFENRVITRRLSEA
jgi:hypothetical protein